MTTPPDVRGGVHYAVALPLTNDRIHREMPPRSGINRSRLELRAFGCSIRAAAGLAANLKDGSVSNGAADEAIPNRMAHLDDSASARGGRAGTRRSSGLHSGPRTARSRQKRSGTVDA